MLHKYLDRDEMHSIVSDAPSKHKLNYELFKLDPEEKDIQHQMISMKKDYFNPTDPFY